MTGSEFTREVLRLFLQDMHKLERDNYSPERFSADGIDRSQTFDTEKHAAALAWFCTHGDDVLDAYGKLADQTSRNLYIDVLRYRLAGHLHARINTHVARLADETQAFYDAFRGTVSELTTTGMFGNLWHFDAEWQGTRYTVDTLKNALVSTLVWRQYYFERDGVRIAPELGDYVIDGGACTGDTAVVFSRSVGPTGRVYAFDPIAEHLDVCNVNFGRPDYANVSVMPYGLSDRSIDAPPLRLQSYNPGWRVGADVVPLRRIDDLVIDGRIPRVDYIKMDIEGSEMAALDGALSTIRKFRPKLAISIYHKPDDYFEIIRYLHGLGLGYTLYLDHYTIYDEEAVVYAVA